MDHRTKQSGNRKRVWGYKLPILLDDVYLRMVFKKRSFWATTNFDNAAQMAEWTESEKSRIDDTSGRELLIACRAGKIHSQAT